jgi:hypothetical protein
MFRRRAGIDRDVAGAPSPPAVPSGGMTPTADGEARIGKVDTAANAEITGTSLAPPDLITEFQHAWNSLW